MVQETGQIDWTGAPELDVELLDVNEYSRPGTTLKQVNGIVIHYTANPGSSAMANRDYFEGLKDAHTTKASSHFIVGLEGEVVQCIPTTEIAYASNDRNGDTGIGIAPEDLPRVFERGYTGYNGRTDKRSTGIGLYLCRQIMDRLSHTIRIESEMGVGTRVYLGLDTVEL